MELIKKNIHMEHRIKWASTQISLEEDQNISDQKPDAFKIVCKKADVKVKEVKPVEEAVWVKGDLDYKLLYLTDEKEKRLCSLEGKISFEEKVYTEKNVSGEGLRVQMKVEDLSIRLINSRKLNIRAILELSMIQDELYDEEIVVDVENPRKCEILKKTMEITTITLDTKDIFRIHEEIQVPDGFPNIYNLLWKDVKVEGLTFTPMEGRIAVSGEVKAFFLYEGEEEESTPRFFEISRSFNGMLEIPESRENGLLQMDYEMENMNIEVKPDYDGEEREIDLDIELKIYIKLYNNCAMSMVADAYGIQEKMQPIMKDVNLMKISKRENGKIKVETQWENTEDLGTSLQILHTDGTLLEEEISLNGEEILLEGVVHAEILCALNTENNPYRCVEIDIPYSHEGVISGMKPESQCNGKICIEQISALVQGDRIDVRVILSYQVSIYEKMKEPLLLEMETVDSEEEEKTVPVMSVYFARDNESIWEVGKRYQVSLDSIREINELSEDILEDGQKILIVKETI